MARPDRTRSSRRWSARGPEAGPDRQLPPGDPLAGDGRARGPEPEPGLGDLLRSLANDMSTLVRQEIELARLELMGAVKRTAADGAWIAVGAGVAAVAGICLVLAMALGVGALIGSYWLGTLITGLTLLALAGILVWKGLKGLRSRELAPKRTAESLREDARWAGREAREFKEAIKEQAT